jgi:hypothetical protein
LLNAKARYAELAERFKDMAGRRVRENMPNSTYPDTEAAEEAELERSLSHIDNDKYLNDPEYRSRIQDELARAYQKSVGR